MKRTCVGVALMALVALTGCVTEQPANEEQAKKLGEQCRTYGFAPGTDVFAACVFQLDQQRIASNRQSRMAVAQALSAAGAAQQANRPRQTTCSRTTWGNVNCTTW